MTETEAITAGLARAKEMRMPGDGPTGDAATIVGVSGVTNVEQKNNNGKTKEKIIGWLGAALAIVLCGVVGITLSALWKPPQDWSVVDKGLGYLNTIALTLGTTLAALARPNGSG